MEASQIMLIIQHNISEHDYLLELQLAKPKKAERWVQGYLEASLHGTEAEATELNLTPK